MTGYLITMRRYAVFQGRAARAEYWWFMAGFFVLVVIASIIDAALGTAQSRSGLFTGLVTLVHFLPALSVTVRRLHDLDRTGWWVLLGLTGIGQLVLIVFACQRGTSGPNRFGGPVSGISASTGVGQATASDLTPAAALAQRDPIAEVERLARLRDNGSLSDAEFEAMKAQALDIRPAAFGGR